MQSKQLLDTITPEFDVLIKRVPAKIFSGEISIAEDVYWISDLYIGW